jgi:hypothetical protein
MSDRTAISTMAFLFPPVGTVAMPHARRHWAEV